MPFSDLDILTEPVGRLLSAIVGGLDPRELRTIAVLDIGAPLPDEVLDSLIRSFRGVRLHTEGSVVIGVFATPLEGVRCALDLAERADPDRGRVTGALHDGLMWDSRSDFVEPVSRTAAELADLAGAGQLLITGAVQDAMTFDRRIDTTYVGSSTLQGQNTAVFEVRRVDSNER
jgi:hypothetical protein